MILTDDQLTRMRATVSATLPDTCDVIRLTYTTVQGQTTESESTVANDIACRFDPLSRQDAAGLVAEREASRTYYTVTLPWDAAVESGDRLLFGVVYYEVLQLQAANSWKLDTRLTVARID